MRNVYEEISEIKKIAKYNFKILDREITKLEQKLASIDADEKSSLWEIHQLVKTKREELNVLYFEVNIHNSEYLSSKNNLLTKTGLLMEQIFNINNRSSI